MPRQKNTRPTTIYWLQDTRPEILVEWPQGLPFYCGKTVQNPAVRLRSHRWNAVKDSHGEVGPRLIECDGHVRIVTLEVVPPEGDWCARERHWIAFSRRVFPDVMTNVSDGGQGAAGYIHTEKHRTKMSAMMRGRKRSPEYCANISAAQRGKKLSPEHRAKISAAFKGKSLSSEHRAKISAANTGGKRTDEARAKMRVAKAGTKPSLEAIEKAAAICRGRKISPETRAKISAAHCGRKRSPEAIAKMAAAQRGKKQPPEAIAKAWATRRTKMLLREQA